MHLTFEHVLSFIFKYVWVLCAFILLLELISTGYTAFLFLQTRAESIAKSTKMQVEHKLNITWKLADALAQDLILSDTAISLEKRALYLKPYNQIYELFLIGITDTKGVITSSYDDIPGNIGYRDYFKRVVSTGEAEITDAFPAGADSNTLNYTICVPYRDRQSQQIGGTLIMSIPFVGLNDIIVQTLPGNDITFSLLGSDNRVMADRDTRFVGQPLATLFDVSPYLSEDPVDLVRTISQGESASFWTMYEGRLLLVRYAPIERTHWKLLTSIDAFSSSTLIIRTFFTKALLYLLLFGCISYFGKLYTTRKLKDLNTLVKQVTDLKLQLQSKKLLTSDEFLDFAEISQKGLLDELTSLPTRSVFLHQLHACFRHSDINQRGALLVIDLDDLKYLNDHLGHETGDEALRFFGVQLSAFGEEEEALVSRFGGDEFIIYVPLTHSRQLNDLLHKLQKRLTTTLTASGESVNIHASIGASVYPTDGQQFDILFRCADAALYEAKRAGKNGFRIWRGQNAVPHGGSCFSL